MIHAYEKAFCMAHVFDRCGSPYLLEELVAEGAGGAEALLLQRHVLLGLRVEGGVLDQTVHEQPQVVLHLDIRHGEKG